MKRLSTFARIARLHPLAASLFGFGAVIMVVFVVRTALVTFHWAQPDNRNATPEPWMTPRYVAMSWDIPVTEIATALAIPADMNRRPMLSDIAKARGVPVEQVLDELSVFLSERHPQ